MFAAVHVLICMVSKLLGPQVSFLASLQKMDNDLIILFKVFNSYGRYSSGASC